jgi:hypothetical protein
MPYKLKMRGPEGPLFYDGEARDFNETGTAVPTWEEARAAADHVNILASESGSDLPPLEIVPVPWTGVLR